MVCVDMRQRIAPKRRRPVRLGDEQGMTLVMTTGIMVVLVIVLAGMVEYSTSGARTASRSSASNSAYALAESGISNALSALFNGTTQQSGGGNDASDSDYLPSRTTTFSTGTVTWSGTLASNVWTLTSIGSVRNPTGPKGAPVTRRLTRSVQITIVPGNTVMDRIYVDNNPASTDMTCGIPALKLNKIQIAAPFAARGNVCMTGTNPPAQLLGSRVDIEGQLVMLQPTNSVGTLLSPIQTAQVGGGCRLGSVGSFLPCSNATQVYANTIGSTPEIPARPVFNWAAEYAKAAPGPLHPCDASLLQSGESAGTPPVFDDNGTYSGGAMNGSADITPSTSYICRARDANGNIGELSWNAAQKKLTINGVIFFDSGEDNSKSAQTPVHYYGKGTVFFSAPVQAKLSGETWCAGGTLGVNCAAAPIGTNQPNRDPNTNGAWFIVGDKCVTSCTYDLNFADGAFQAAFYSVHTCHVHGGSAFIAGPLVCGQLDVDGTGTAAFTFPPMTLYEDPGPAHVDLTLGPQSE